MFNRKYIFKGSIFHCYVSLAERNPTYKWVTLGWKTHIYRGVIIKGHHTHTTNYSKNKIPKKIPYTCLYCFIPMKNGSHLMIRCNEMMFFLKESPQLGAIFRSIKPAIKLGEFRTERCGSRALHIHGQGWYWWWQPEIRRGLTSWGSLVVEIPIIYRGSKNTSQSGCLGFLNHQQ